MNETIGIIPRAFRRRGVWVACTLLLRAGLNFLGLAMLLPVLALVLDPGSLEGGGVLTRAYEGLGFASQRTFALAVCAAVVGVIVLKCLLGLWLARIGVIRSIGEEADLSLGPVFRRRIGPVPSGGACHPDIVHVIGLRSGGIVAALGRIVGENPEVGKVAVVGLYAFRPWNGRIPYPVVEPDGVVRGLQGFIPSPAARYKSRQAENRPKPISSCFHIRNL